MWEQSKAAKRRYNIGAFHQRYFVGHGIDIGGKPDPLSQYIGVFPCMQSVKIWDLEDGDAQFLASVSDQSFDFVHASHCLEHLNDPIEGLSNWIRVTKEGGYLIITVPDEDMYEQGSFPSRYNADHKWTFTMFKEQSWSPRSINVLELVAHFANQCEVEKIETLRDFFRPDLLPTQVDQSMTPVTECAIEFILRKK